MNESFLTLWKEPLYRLILQVTIAEVVMLGLIILGIIVTRWLRIMGESRRDRISRALFEPLMSYLAGDLSLADAGDLVKKFPKRHICLELERYVLMVEGQALSNLRALYEQLNLRHYGLSLAHSFLWWRRLEGIRLLGATGGEDIVEVMMDAMSDKHPVVRLAAIRSLGRIRNIKAIRPLLDLLSRSGQLSRRQIAEALTAFGTDVHPFLRRMLADEKGDAGDPHFLATVIEVLALTGAVEAQSEICASLVSKHLEVRIAAFKAAAILYLPLTADTLTLGLTDAQWQVRAQAASAAGKIKEESVIPTLGRCLEDRSWWVRNNAGQALIACGERGIDALKRIAVESTDPFARDMALKTLSSDPVCQMRNLAILSHISAPPWGGPV